MRSTEAAERTPDAEPATAVPAAPGRDGALALVRLPRGVGNRAVARFIGPALREARFRALVGSDAAERGQMLFHSKISDLLWPKVNAAVAGDAGLTSIWNGFIEALWPADGNVDWAKADSIRKEFKDTKFPQDLIGPDDARLEVGAQVFEKLWKQYADPKAGAPDLTPYVTIGHYLAIKHWELIACKRTATLLAKRYVAAGGSGSGARSAGTAIKPTQLIASVKLDKTPLGGDLYRGSVATYSSELGKEVERMKRAIDDGWVVHARVLSGAAGGGKDYNQPEHSLVVYGYTGDAFEYFDPDVAGSNVKKTGFDRIYYDRNANRLSTAASDADFASYGHEKDEPGHRYGYQVSGVHRYQVASIETL